MDDDYVAHGTSRFPPEFWDGLSKVWLTLRALQELDRRRKIQRGSRPAIRTALTKDSARYARHGGPDLRHLRGGQTSNRIPTQKWKSRPASSCDENFEQQMVDDGIYPLSYHNGNHTGGKPHNLHESVEILPMRRPSLSSSTLAESMFKRFERSHKRPYTRQACNMDDVIPIFTGNANIQKARNPPFSNVDAMPAACSIRVVPAFFDGALPDAVEQAVRDNLDRMIVPTKLACTPIAPNVFFEVTPKRGKVIVTRRKAFQYGAIGARAMLALQNYGADEPVFDGKAYTYSAAYHPDAEIFEIFAHHITPPTTPEGRLQYHTTQLGLWEMKKSIEDFVRGVTAFRNVRDLAQRQRDEFIRVANERARQLSEEEEPGEKQKLGEKREPSEGQNPIAETMGVVAEGE